MADRIERTYAGQASKDIFDRLVLKLGELAPKYSLKVESDPSKLSGRVHRTGADVKFKIVGDKLDVNLDFSMLVPGSIRQKVKDELSQRLDGLFEKKA